MHLGPTFRRFRAMFFLLAVVTVGCSSPVRDNADAPPVSNGPTTTEQSPLPSTTLRQPGDGNTETPELDLTTPERQPPATLDALVGLPGRILFRSSQGAITTMTPDGQELVEMSDAAAGRHSQPTWSGDGSRVSWASIGPTTGATIVTALTNGTEVVEIPSPTPAFYLAWSPDGSTLAGLGPNAQGVELFFADVATSAVTRVGTGQPFFFDWTGDDAVVASISDSVLTEISAANNTATDIELPGALGVFQAPASLDGERTLVALSNGTRGNDLAIIDGTTTETIARAPGPVTFSPNPVNDSIAVLVNANVTDSQPIFFQDDAPPTLPPNRVTIIDPTTAVEQTLDIDGVLTTQWSPDGTMLGVLVAQANGLEWRFVRDTEIIAGDPFVPSQEFFNSYVPFADQYERSSTWWSPDSRAIVFAGAIDGEEGVWVDLVDDERGAVRVADGDIAFWSPAS